MRKLLAEFLLLVTLPCLGQSSRDYYNELYKAGGLDRMADGYVCFDEDPALKTFFIFGQSEILKRFLQEGGQFAKLPASEKALLNKGYLNVRTYDRGVPHAGEELLMKDDDSWVTDPFILAGSTKGRLRITIAWETLRYKRMVEVRDSNGVYQVRVTRYGRCEVVPPDVRQKGEPR